MRKIGSGIGVEVAVGRGVVVGKAVLVGAGVKVEIITLLFSPSSIGLGVGGNAWVICRCSSHHK